MTADFHLKTPSSEVLFPSLGELSPASSTGSSHLGLKESYSPFCKMRFAIN